MKRLAAFAALACLALPAAEAIGRRPPPPLADLPKSEVQVVTATGAHRFQVWIAADQPSRGRGLMFVRELPEDCGMLFVFAPPQHVAFWMQNTYLSLDLLFIAADGHIVNIIERAVPMSTDPLESKAPVAAVLEVLGGTASRLGIRPGDRLSYRALEPVPPS